MYKIQIVSTIAQCTANIHFKYKKYETPKGTIRQQATLQTVQQILK